MKKTFIIISIALLMFLSNINIIYATSISEDSEPICSYLADNGVNTINIYLYNGRYYAYKNDIVGNNIYYEINGGEQIFGNGSFPKYVTYGDTSNNGGSKYYVTLIYSDIEFTGKFTLVENEVPKLGYHEAGDVDTYGDNGETEHVDLPPYYSSSDLPPLNFIDTEKTATCTELTKLKDIIDEKILQPVRYAVPIIFLIMTSIDFAKGVFMDDKNGIGKAKNNLFKRIAISIIVFFVPNIVEMLFNLFGLGCN